MNAIATPTPSRFRAFVDGMTALVSRGDADEPMLLDVGERLLADLVNHDDWLPDNYAQPSNQSYRQYLLYRDPQARFSVVSFVWQPGQSTPVHDHTVWGLVGVMRGEEMCEEYADPAGGAPLRRAGQHALPAGAIDRVSPRIGDVHRVSNAGRTTAISIHVYGADIGATRRHIFDADTGAVRDFVSGYSNGSLPPLLDAGSDR
jgi:3-mercaptopropionate dioxygenase